MLRSEQVIAASLLVAGLAHLLPVTGVLGVDRLAALYGVRLTDPDLVVLMRHRAVLFGLLGAGMIAAIFIPTLQLAMLVAGLVSVLSFLWLAWPVSDHNSSITTVFVVDVVVILFLVSGLIIYVNNR